MGTNDETSGELVPVGILPHRQHPNFRGGPGTEGEVGDKRTVPLLIAADLEFFEKTGTSAEALGLLGIDTRGCTFVSIWVRAIDAELEVHVRGVPLGLLTKDIPAGGSLVALVHLAHDRVRFVDHYLVVWR